MTAVNDINLCAFTGRLTRDSELKYLPTGTAVCNFSLAFTRVTGSGENRKDKSCFIECVIWGKFGEAMSQFLMQGTQIAVAGELDFETWEKDGAKRSKHKLIVRDLRLMGGKKEGSYMPTETGVAPTGDYDDDLPF